MSAPSDPEQPADLLSWNENAVERFRASLLDFFQEVARDLPWRAGPGEAPDPYGVLVSEVMLQQTRVTTVIPFFHRWMERFPTPEALADAELDEVLAVWQGLGYYSRARNLHGAVRELVERYDGALPREPDALESLPGIGPYTAGAIASIAFGVPAPAVDGNVRRVLSRLSNHPSPSPSVLGRWASKLVDPTRPGDFNQALMELGALICGPRNPMCDQCPVSAFCAAHAAGTQGERPAPRARGPVARVTEAVAILERRHETEPVILLRKRRETGLLAGMWELPGRQVEGAADPREVAQELAIATLRELGAGPESVLGEARALSSLDHAFSHRKVRYLPFWFDVEAGTFAADGDGSPPRLRWTGAAALGGLPIPAAQRKLLSLHHSDKSEREIPMYQTVLVPLDGSEFAEDALPLARLLSRKLNAELHLAHVIQNVYDEDMEWREKAREGTKRYLEQHAAEGEEEGVSTLTTVLEGRIAQALSEYIEEQGVDLVALTSHGRGGVGRWWLGSVADSLLRMADADVLLVRPWDDTEDRPRRNARFERIMVPLDGSEDAEFALPSARSLAERFGATVTLVRVVPEPIELTSIYGVPGVEFAGAGHRDRIKEAETYLTSVTGTLKGLDVDKRVVESGGAAEGIVEAARTLNADLIVLSSHGRGGMERAVLGSVADKVIRRTTRPVLAVRQRERSDDPS